MVRLRMKGGSTGAVVRAVVYDYGRVEKCGSDEGYSDANASSDGVE